MPRMPGWHVRFQRIILTGDRDATAVASGLPPFSLPGLEVMDSKKHSTRPLVERIGHWRKHRRRWSLADVDDSQDSSSEIPL